MRTFEKDRITKEETSSLSSPARTNQVYYADGGLPGNKAVNKADIEPETHSPRADRDDWRMIGCAVQGNSGLALIFTCSLLVALS